MVMTNKQANIETVKQFLHLLEKENIPAYLDLFAPEGMQINPYASGLFPDTVKGRAALEAYWQPVPGRFDGMQFPIEEIFPMEDPALVLVKFKGIIKLKDNAGIYSNDYLCLFKFNEQGKILEYHEYFNPLTVVRAFGLKDKI
jgi:ketosteroid isomerase-like protein